MYLSTKFTKKLRVEHVSKHVRTIFLILPMLLFSFCGFLILLFAASTDIAQIDA